MMIEGALVKTNVLLCIPEIKSKQLQDIYPPIGLAYIHSSLLAAGYHVSVINLNFHKYDEMAKIMLRNEIGFVMSGGTSYDYQALEEVFTFAKMTDSTVITIGGGVGYTSEPIVFSELTKVDYAVIGEGEKANVRLLEYIIHRKPITELSGIIYKDENGNYRKAKPAVPVQNIDELPFPNYDGFEIENYFQNQIVHGFPRHFSDIEQPRIMLMMNSRSCPYSCSFCLHPVGSKYRERDINLVFEEIHENIRKYSINGIFFADELFANKIERVKEFCNRIKPLKLKWFVELRVDFVTEHLIRMLKDAGCVSVLLGLEGFTDKILKDMRKGITPYQIRQAVEIMDRVGMRMEGHFIFGTPLEDENTFLDIFNFWRSYRHTGVDIVWLFLYPGTRYYELACERGIIRDRKQFIINKMPHLNITSMPDGEYYKYARLGSLTLSDEDHYGDIEQRSMHGKYCNLTLRCPRCGKRFIHNNIPAVDVNQSTGRISLEIPCEYCGRYSNYPIRDSDAWVSTLIARQMEYNHNIGYDIEMKLIKQSISSIAIVGIKEIVSKIEKEFSAIHVVFSKGLNSLDEVGELKETSSNYDAILVADPKRYEKISRRILNQGIKKPAISVTNLLFDFEYHTSLEGTSPIEV